MIRTIQTTYRYRLQPTTQQEALFRQFVGARCFVWNWGLARKREYYQATGKTLSHNALSRELTELKCQPATTWLCEIYAQSLQQALRDLERAFQAFFRRVRTGAPKKGYPKFKSKKTDPLSFRLSQHVQIEGEFVHVPKIGRIKAIIHRRIEGVTKSATFKQAPDGHWCVCLVVEQLVPEQQPRPVQSYVGVDVGLKTLGVLSNSEMIANPRFYRTQIGKLARAQRALSRKQKDSRNRGKARRKVACIYNKITNQRKDFLHKLSIDLVRRFNLISIEDLTHLIMVPIVDEAHAREELARAMHIGFVADLEALDKDLDDLRSKVKHVSPDAIARRLEKFKAVRDRARTYATLLSLQQETIAEKIDALHQKATAMLTGSEDDLLPEASVSVTAVPRQEPARRTASATAGLVDDDPDAAF